MPVTRHVLTLDEFTIQQLRMFPNATGELSTLLREIGLAAKRINVEVNKAGLADILGSTGYVNVHAEAVHSNARFYFPGMFPAKIDIFCIWFKAMVHLQLLPTQLLMKAGHYGGTLRRRFTICLYSVSRRMS